ncbi:MAG: glycosyltransferase [Rubrivivax sp.]|nr:glycosyltransferase [Rubrivivax sp.]
MSESPSLTMLYFVGAGPAAISRVDIAHLFGERLAQDGLAIDWYVRTPQRGGPLMRLPYHGRPARQCGRSGLPGAAGRAMGKLQEFIATLHFFGTALSGRHDLIQVRDDFLGGLLGLAAARLRRRPFVFWLSYPFPEARLLDVREGRARWRLYAWLSGHLSGWALYRVLLRHADHLFVQSEQMKRDLLRPGVDPARLTPVPMGLPDGDLPPLSPPSDEPVVLYLGTLARVRRLAMIVEAFAHVHSALPGARLIIVGEGDVPEDRAALERAVNNLGLSGAVTFTGQLPRGQALEWVTRAAVCLSPFYPTFVLRSTSPTKLVEYLALGKPVVVNDHPEQAAVVAASGAGSCTPWDARAYGEAILELLRDPSRRAAAGRAGRDWVVAHRLYSRIAAGIMDRYRRLVATDATSAETARPR